MSVPYVFGNATTAIPLSNLDANFNTGLTIGNTTVGLGNTTTTLGNVTLTNATIVANTSSIAANAVVYTTSTGNLTGNASVFSVNGTNVGVGISNPSSKFVVSGYSGSLGGVNGIANFTSATTGGAAIQMGDTVASVISGSDGTNAFISNNGNYDLRFLTNSGERMRITSGGGVLIGNTSDPLGANKLLVQSSSVANNNRTFSVYNTTATSATPFANRLVQISSNGSGADATLQFSDQVANNAYIGMGSGALYFASNAIGELMRLDSSGNLGIGTSSPGYPLCFSGSNTTYKATGTLVGMGTSGFSGYGPHIGTTNRTYVHYIGAGGGSAHNTWIHGYQVGNPAGSNFIRVAPGISGNPVTGFTIGDSSTYFYWDNNKTTGDPDYTPTIRSGQNQYGYFVGNAAGTSGTGYTFPATQDPSSNANTLDDYEEGTWTPVIASQTGSLTSYTSSGTYVKIGKAVYIIAKFSVVTTGTASGYANVSGYPFTSASTYDSNGSAREGASTGDVFDAILPSSATAGFILGLTGNGPISWTAGRTYYWNIFYNV